jgi:hypothetical protein
MGLKKRLNGLWTQFIFGLKRFRQRRGVHTRQA